MSDSKNENCEAFLLQKFQSFYKEGSFFDITLVAGIDKTKIKAHRIIISAWSDYCSALFSSTFKEADDGQIKIKAVNGATLKAIVDYMYSSKIDLSSETIEDILVAADYLRIPRLIRICFEYMENHLGPHNCLGVALFSLHHSFANLHLKSKLYAQKHFEAVRCEQEFLELSKEQLLEYLGSDNLHVASEDSIFHSSLAWINYNEKERAEFAHELMRLFPLRHEKQGTIIKDKNTSVIPTPKSRNISSNMEYIVLGNSTSGLKVLCLDENQKWVFLNFPPPPTDKTDCGVCYNNLKLIIVGGSTGLVRSLGLGITNTVEYLDLITQKWTKLPSMIHKRQNPLVFELDDKIYVIGGLSSKCEKYCPSECKWVEIAPLPGVYQRMEGAVLRGLIYVTDIISSSMCSYCPRTNKWTTRKSKNIKTQHFSFAAGNDCYLLAAGGVFNGKKCTYSELYMPEADSWVRTTDLPEARSHLKCVRMGKQILLIGGQNSSHNRGLVHAFNLNNRLYSLLPSIA